MSTIDPHQANWGPAHDLEEQQYKTLYHEYDVPLEDLRKRSFFVFSRIVLVLFVIMIILGSWVPIPNYLELPIVINNTEVDQIRQFDHPVRLNESYVQVGQEVQLGQRLCKIQAPQIKALIASIWEAEYRIEALDKHDTQDLELQSQHFDKQIFARKGRIEALDAEMQASQALFNAQRKVIQDDLTFLEQIKNTNKMLWEQGAESKMNYESAAQDYLARKDELVVLEKNAEQARAQFALRKKELLESKLLLQTQKDERLQNHQTERSKLLDQIALMKQNLKLYYGAYTIEHGALILLAEQAGTITYVCPNNELLQTGEMLFRLELEQGEYLAQARVPASQIGYIQPDMSGKVMLETFPHFEWGSLEAEVEFVSKAPNEQGEFHVSIRLPTENPKISPLLQRGQVGDCALAFESKSLFGYILRDFRRRKADFIY